MPMSSRHCRRQIEDYKELGQENIVVYPVGRKIAEKAVKLGLPVANDFNNLCDHPCVNGCVDIAKDVAGKFRNGEIDKVELIYHHFKSAGSQVLKRKTYLPIDITEVDFNEEKVRDLKTQIATKETQEYLARHAREEAEKANEDVVPLNDNFIVEPDLYTVLSRLIPQYLKLKVYTALLDSNASEHAARMVAMQTATDNADELLRVLNLQYNKSRQQAITNELLDLAGGSQN